MKLYKSLLFGLLMCGFAACDTSDLERDIDSLKDRVEDYEAQVQKLNEDMNIIRVLLDGNKTITEWSLEGDNYVLKLSNGETVTLTPGVVGENYPSITIGENGNWFIGGNDSGVRAVAQDGEDALFTPQFKIENGNWWVNYENGKADAWIDLGVPATGTSSSATSPVQSVDTSDANVFKITLSDGQTYSIPVIQDLVCEITEPVLKKGEMWMIGGEATLKVKVNIKPGDIIRPVVPADWKAEIMTDYAGLTGEQTLDVKVTPPASASKCVVAMEVNRGVNTVTDEIVARTEISSYWDEYQAGFDVIVGDENGVCMVINKSDVSLPVKHITTSSSAEEKTINAAGIYFVDSDVEGVTHKRFGISSLIIIGNNADKQSKLSLPSDNDYFNLASTGKGLLLKNMELDLTGYNKEYVINEGGNEATFDYVLFDGCKFKMKGTNNVNFLSVPEKTNIHITSIGFYKNKVRVPASEKGVNLVSLTNKSGVKFTGYERFVCEQNVFYSPQKESGCFNFSLFQANLNETKMEVVPDMIVNNNTFVNLFSLNGMLRARMKNVTSNANLLWNDYDADKSRSWIIAVKRSDSSLPSDLGDMNLLENTVFDQTAKGKSWMMFHSNGYRPDNYGDYTFNYLDKDPFEVFDIEHGIFKVSAAYEGIGASLD